MNKIAQTTIGLLERQFLKSATVLAIRSWGLDTFREIDLHMPGCDMSKWQQAQHMKCRVAPYVYRDYTPAGWDAETQTCTLYIDAAHDGPGSRWVRGLRVGDIVPYIGVASSHQAPIANKRLVFLGDETAIGHIFALQQLAGRNAEMSGAIVLSDEVRRDEFAQYFAHQGLEALSKSSSGDYSALEEWTGDLDPMGAEQTVFYLVGYSPAVGKLRKFLRQLGYSGSQVKAQGFWN